MASSLEAEVILETSVPRSPLCFKTTGLAGSPGGIPSRSGEGRNATGDDERISDSSKNTIGDYTRKFGISNQAPGS